MVQEGEVEEGYAVKGDVEEVKEGFVEKGEGDCSTLLLWHKSN